MCGKSVQGFLSYARKKKQTNIDYNFIHIEEYIHQICLTISSLKPWAWAFGLAYQVTSTFLYPWRKNLNMQRVFKSLKGVLD